MAKNYTFAEAVKIIAEGKDTEVIQELGKRFPLMLHYVSKVVAKAGEDFVALASKMPEFLTANKVNAALKSDASEADETESEETEAEEVKEVKEEKAEAKTEEAPKGKRGRKPKAESEKVEKVEKKEEKEAEDEYSAMGAKELFLECKKRGIKVEPKKPSAFYADLLRKDDAAKKSDDEDWDDGEDSKDSDDEDWDI